MAALYLDEITDPKLLALPKYAVGDRMRIVNVNGDIDKYAPAIKAVVGRVLTIKDILFWEYGDPENPTYLVSYEFYIAHLTGSANRHSNRESLYLDDDEIEPVRRQGKVAESG